MLNIFFWYGSHLNHFPCSKILISVSEYIYMDLINPGTFNSFRLFFMDRIDKNICNNVSNKRSYNDVFNKSNKATET